MSRSIHLLDELTGAIALLASRKISRKEFSIDAAIAACVEVANAKAECIPLPYQEFFQIQGTVTETNRWGGIVYAMLEDDQQKAGDDVSSVMVTIPVSVLKDVGCSLGLCRGPWDRGLGTCRGPCCKGTYLRGEGIAGCSKAGKPVVHIESLAQQFSAERVISEVSHCTSGQHLTCSAKPVLSGSLTIEVQTGGSSVLHEDSMMLAVQKPAGIIVHSARGARRGELTMFDAVWKARGLARGDLNVLHRLDVDTSGVLVFGKNAGARRLLGNDNWALRTRKEYLALVSGLPEHKTWTVDAPLLKAARSSAGKLKRQEPEEQVWQDAKTGFEVLVDLPACNLTLVRCELLRGGRTHQIRRHLQQSGHGIVGDSSYGNPEANRVLRKSYHCNRIFLHHWRLTITAKADDELGITQPLCINAQLPHDLVEFAGRLPGAFPAFDLYC